MTVLIITRSDDNASIPKVENALADLGKESFRLETDRFPQDVQISTQLDDKGARGVIKVGDRSVELEAIESVWYRRFFAGGRLPGSLGDTRKACVDETRRHAFGFIEGLPCFHMDPLSSVRRTDHKELQMRRAHALGLKIPPTLFSNDPDEVRAFFARYPKVITKMQHSFAIYREGVENVVYTNVLDQGDIEDLSGLAFCPMTFQALVEKEVELRVTVVGHEVFCAQVDSKAQEKTAVDWRRDGVGLLNSWTPYELPKDVKDKLLKLVSELGLNYAASDFIVTPAGEHVFLEVNAVGEFFWLELKSPGFPISRALAKTLTDENARRAVNTAAWENYV